MNEFKCRSRDRLGCLIETKHDTLGLAILEGERRKSQGHTDVTIDNGATPPSFSACPGDVYEWRHSEPKMAKIGRPSKRNRTSILEAL